MGDKKMKNNGLFMTHSVPTILVVAMVFLLLSGSAMTSDVDIIGAEPQTDEKPNCNVSSVMPSELKQLLWPSNKISDFAVKSDFFSGAFHAGTMNNNMWTVKTDAEYLKQENEGLGGESNAEGRDKMSKSLLDRWWVAAIVVGGVAIIKFTALDDGYDKAIPAFPQPSLRKH
jgi:hypothetical protein